MFSPKTEAANAERLLYLYSLSELVSRPALGAAVSLLSGWSRNAKGRNVAAAACHYLAHNVVPMLQEGGVPSDRIPAWVDAVLFHPLEYKPVAVGWKEWMAFFGADEAFVKIDEKDGPVILDALPESVEWALERKAGVHFVPFVLGEKPTGTHKTRRSKDNAKAALCLMADLDKGTKAEMWDKLLKSPIQPSMVVETARGYHAYWPLNAPGDVFLWERVQDTMNEFFGSDRAIKTAAHGMRMPSSWHCKEEPFWVQVVFANWKRHDMRDLELAWPPKPLPKPYAPREFRPIDGVRLPSTNSLPTGASHDTLVSESGRVYAGIRQENAGLARKMVVDWFTGFKENKKPTDYAEANRRCDELEIKQFGSVVSR